MSKQTKKQSQKATSAPVIVKGQEKAVLEKLIRNATSYDQAWRLIHKAFPRKQYGRVREVVQKFSSHRTLRAAFNSVHGKGSKKGKPAKRGAQSEPMRRAA